MTDKSIEQDFTQSQNTKLNLNNSEPQPSQTRIAQSARDVKFSDLASAGADLTAQLNNYTRAEDTVVVAIARGGVPVALEVANRLSLPLDIILIRRLLAGDGPGSEICAVNVCGTLILDPQVSLPATKPETPLEYFVADALAELALREQACRGGRPALRIEDKTVLLIDNGIHTGSTVLTSLRALRTLKPSRVIVGVPVAAPSSRAAIEAVVDDLVSLAWPEPFVHVGLWYANFNVPNEEQILKMLDQVSVR